MHAPETCSCGKGSYRYGSALYAYYTCGHAYQKPMSDEKHGRFLNKKFNPYQGRNR